MDAGEDEALGFVGAALHAAAGFVADAVAVVTVMVVVVGGDNVDVSAVGFGPYFLHSRKMQKNGNCFTCFATNKKQFCGVAQNSAFKKIVGGMQN